MGIERCRYAYENILLEKDRTSTLPSTPSDSYPEYFRPDQHYSHLRKLYDVMNAYCTTTMDIKISGKTVCIVQSLTDESKIVKASVSNWKATNPLGLACLVAYHKTYVAQSN